MKQIRLWSQKVFDIFSLYKNNPNKVLFSITGDIDNLGIFVARNGRPKAENLVDVYNHIVGFLLYDYIESKSGIEYLAIVPSGEELFCIGIASDEDEVLTLFNWLYDNINSQIHDHVPSSLLDLSVTISFGCTILNRKYIIEDILNLIELVGNNKINKASDLYLVIMLKIRTILSHDLDLHKFSNLHNYHSQPRLVASIFFRNVVYWHLMKYKHTTKKSLINIAHNLSTIDLCDLQRIAQNHGEINDDDLKLLEKIILNK